MTQRVASLALGTLLVFTVAVPAVAGSFTDVPETNVFHDDIEWLAGEGITAGCNPPANDHYCPTKAVTRGQMAAFLVRALGLTDNGGGNHFTDDDGTTFENDIDKLYTAGITQGCNPPTNDNYCPTKAVTRGQMAAFLVRALGLTDNGGGNHFTDDDGTTFENDIDKLYTAGITQGCNPPTNDNYCPTKNVTRQQMAAFLRRALDEPPAMVTGLIATLSGGSGEIDVSWDPNTESDIDHYNVWWSLMPGGTKTLITDPFVGPDVKPSGRVFIIDDERSLVAGQDCYQVSAVDTGGLEGPRSVEECFDPDPGTPSQVMNVTVGLAGGSGEVWVSWIPNPEGDISHYNAYFSETRFGLYVFETSVDDSQRSSGRVYFIGTEKNLTDNFTCYKIAAVDYNGHEGPLSAEGCFDSSI